MEVHEEITFPVNRFAWQNKAFKFILGHLIHPRTTSQKRGQKRSTHIHLQPAPYQHVDSAAHAVLLAFIMHDCSVVQQVL